MEERILSMQCIEINRDYSFDILHDGDKLARGDRLPEGSMREVEPLHKSAVYRIQDEICVVMRVYQSSRLQSE